MNAVAQQPSFTAAAEAGLWLRKTLNAGADLHLSSLDVAQGDGFLAMPGQTVDGRRFIADAIERGAAAVLAQHESTQTPAQIEPASVAQATLAELTRHCGDVAAAFYGDPSEALEIIAVTGTNGKTSCANWIASGGATDATSTAAIGTLGVRQYQGGDLSVSPVAQVPALTTPDAVSLQRVLAALVRAGTTSVAIEASSIGLDQHRLGGVKVDAAIFTNLSRDHLDYHGSDQAYAQAKALLFARPELKVAIVNGDDPAAEQMLAETAPGVQTIAYGFTPARHGSAARQKVTIAAIEPGESHDVLHLAGDLGETSVPVELTGRFNALNAAAVWATWRALGVSEVDSSQRLTKLLPVPGRMQAIRVDGAPLAIVDYAHTPDALQSVLSALTDQAKTRGGKLWCVFGCGGDRDNGKRPLMAAAAEAVADELVLTSDNPRGESAEQILNQMLAGLKEAPRAVITDRAGAIEAAVSQAGLNDIVLVAGKGHEATQEIAGVKHPFLDEAVALAALQRRALHGQGFAEAAGV